MGFCVRLWGGCPWDRMRHGRSLGMLGRGVFVARRDRSFAGGMVSADGRTWFLANGVTACVVVTYLIMTGMLGNSPGRSENALMDGRPTPHLREVIGSFSRAVALKDTGRLLDLSPTEGRDDPHMSVNVLLSRYGGLSVRPVGYDSQLGEEALVTFHVECAGGGAAWGRSSRS